MSWTMSIGCTVSPETVSTGTANCERSQHNHPSGIRAHQHQVSPSNASMALHATSCHLWFCGTKQQPMTINRGTSLGTTTTIIWHSSIDGNSNVQSNTIATAEHTEQGCEQQKYSLDEPGVSKKESGAAPASESCTATMRITGRVWRADRHPTPIARHRDAHVRRQRERDADPDCNVRDLWQ